MYIDIHIIHIWWVSQLECHTIDDAKFLCVCCFLPQVKLPKRIWDFFWSNKSPIVISVSLSQWWRLVLRLLAPLPFPDKITRRQQATMVVFNLIPIRKFVLSRSLAKWCIQKRIPRRPKCQNHSDVILTWASWNTICHEDYHYFWFTI